MFCHVSVLHSFLLPSSFPLCGYTISYLFILKLIDVWVVSPFLTFMNNAAVNICEESVFLNKHPT